MFSKLGYKKNSKHKNRPYNLINSPSITMKGVDFPVLGIGDNGVMKLMNPGEDHFFEGAKTVLEFPMKQQGGSLFNSNKKLFVDSVLNSNKNLNWVKRLYEENPASINIPGQPFPSTHFMESSDNEVYPTVVDLNGSLKYLGNKARKFADSTNTSINFINDEQAQWFGENYKMGTNVLKKKLQKGGFPQFNSLSGDTTGQGLRNLKKNSLVYDKLKTKPVEAPEEVLQSQYNKTLNHPKTPLERLDSAHQSNILKYYHFLNTDNTSYSRDEESIDLTSGKFNTGKVPNRMVDDLVKSAKSNGLDPYTMLGLAGQESTFGKGYVGAASSKNIISGWDLGEKYSPYLYARFLADKKIPGVSTKKNSWGYEYNFNNEDSINSYLSNHPKISEDYFDKLNNQERPETFSYFDEAAKRIKAKGIQNYNAGDPNYSSDVNNSINLLKKDKNLTGYLKSKGYIKQKGGVKKYQGAGLFDPENILQTNNTGLSEDFGYQTPSDYPNSSFDSSERQPFSYSGLPLLFDSALSTLANGIDNRRKDQYRNSNLANPFNYLPKNNPTSDYEKFGNPSFQDGGQTDDSFDDSYLWDEEDDSQSAPDNEEVDTPEQQAPEEIPDEVNTFGNEDINTNQDEDFDGSSLVNVPKVGVVPTRIDPQVERLTNIYKNNTSSLADSISERESGGNYTATNPNSSAAGKYQFLWNTWKPKIGRITGIKTKQDFLNNPDAQEQFYSWYEQNELKPAVNRIKPLAQGYSDKQLAKLIHYRGEKGAMDYLNGDLGDKPEKYNMSISKYIN